MRKLAIAVAAAILVAGCSEPAAPEGSADLSHPPAADLAGADLVASCALDFHLCGGRCVDSRDPATCGISCTPCSAPAHATATCNGSQCGLHCDGGFTSCGNACIPQTT